MQRYKFWLQYVGSAYSGVTRQPKHKTVLQVVDKAVSTFINNPVKCTASGRTDAGVHAIGQVLHVDLLRTTKLGVQPAPKCGSVQEGVNHHLRQAGIDDIFVQRVCKVPSTFHARHSAAQRSYLYRVLTGTPSLHERERAWHVRSATLDVDAMQQAARFLLGTHDFTTFRAAGCAATSAIRTLDAVSVQKMPSEHAWTVQDPKSHELPEPSLYHFTFLAQSFLYHQVRSMVASLVAVGSGKLQPEAVRDVLAARDHKLAEPMAPAHGLFLTHVRYPAEFERPCPSFPECGCDLTNGKANFPRHQPHALDDSQSSDNVNS